MSRLLTLIAAFCAVGAPSGFAFGHGFNLTAVTDGNGNFISITAASESAILDQVNNTSGPSNLFLDSFGGTPYGDSMGTFYTTTEGFAVQPGSWPAYKATFSIVSPLIYSGGLDSSGGQSGPAIAASASGGTFIDMWDPYAGNFDGHHPGASLGDVYLSGSASYLPGFGVSLFDPHELEKDIYLASGGTQTFGEFGYAFTISVTSSSGQTYTTGPLIDAFALSDANNGGDFSAAPTSLQVRATTALYDAVMGSTSTVWATATSGAWANGSNWIGGAAPAGSSHVAVFAQPTLMTLDITLTGAQTAGGLYFSNTASSTAGYALTGDSTAALVLADTATPVSIVVAGGSNSINLPLILTGNLTIAPTAGSTLAISGAIGQSGGSMAVALADAGTLILSGSNTFSGGITASAGTLELLGASSLLAGSSLVIGSGSSDGAAFQSPATSKVDIAPVPEPCTLSLALAATAIGLALRFKRRK